MKLIAERGSRSLNIGSELDKGNELEIEIANYDDYDFSIYIDKEEIKALIDHLQEVLDKSK